MFKLKKSLCAPYGPQGGGGGGAFAAGVGFDSAQIPALTPGYRNAFADSGDLRTGSWIASNVSVTQILNVLSPLGGNTTYQITDTSGAAIGTLRNNNAQLNVPDFTIFFVYVRIAPTDSPNAQIRFESTDGVLTVDGSININCVNGNIVSSSQLNCGIEIEALEVATTTWVKITCTSTKRLAVGASAFITFTPGASGVGAVDTILVSNPMAVDWTIAQDTASGFVPAYLEQSISFEASLPVKIPAMAIDWGFKSAGVNKQFIDLTADLGRYFSFASDTTLFLPNPNLVNANEQWEGFTCYIEIEGTDVDLTIDVASGVGATARVYGLDAASVFPFVLNGGTGNDNTMMWKLVLSWQPAPVWIFIPMAAPHGTAVFNAPGNFVWPLGVKTVFASGAGGGGGGGGGTVSSVTASNKSGGGGGGAESCIKRAISNGTPGTTYAVLVGVGGTGGAGATGGAAGTAGGNGGVTSLGALLSLAGGIGGSGASGAINTPANGGERGGPGGSRGESGIGEFVVAAVVITQSLRGAGGGTQLAPQTNIGTSNAGEPYGGGGSGGAGANNQGDAGGAGGLILEW